MGEFETGYMEYLKNKNHQQKIQNEQVGKSVHFIITGGTIDSYYDGVLDTVVPSKMSNIPEYIRSLKLYCKVAFTQICMKDSRNLNENDLKQILETIENSPINKIIVTHGTYTMPHTARYLKEKLRSRKTVILTGSLIPLSIVNSDGGFNIGVSMAKLQHLGNGVFVCMNGEIFDADRVTKLTGIGVFSSIQ